MSKSQTDRVIARRAVSLQTRGVSPEVIDRNISKLPVAQEEAVRELQTVLRAAKAGDAIECGSQRRRVEQGNFHLVAADRPAAGEIQAGHVRDGSLANLYVQLREQKGADKVLETSQIEEVEVKG